MTDSLAVAAVGCSGAVATSVYFVAFVFLLDMAQVAVATASAAAWSLTGLQCLASQRFVRWVIRPSWCVGGPRDDGTEAQR